MVRILYYCVFWEVQEKLTMGDRSDLKYAQKIHPETETFILLWTGQYFVLNTNKTKAVHFFISS